MTKMMSNKETKIFHGLPPKKWQSIVHNKITQLGPQAGATIVVKAKRQIGKTVIIQQELLRHAINYPGSTNICLSLTIVNCRKIYKELVRGCVCSGIISKNNDALLEIEFINGSIIYFKSAVQKENLRGYTVRGGGILCIDEAAYIQDEIFDIISPWTDVNNANTLMVSTPRLKQGRFYELYTIGMAHLSEKVFSFDLCKYDTSEMLSKEKLELYKKTMPTNQFLTEYLGEFADSGGNVFKIDYIKWKSIINYHCVDTTDSYNELYIGVDWGTGENNDYTSVTAFDENKEQKLLFFSNNFKDSTEQIKSIVEHILKLNIKKIKKILVEKNSIGKVYGDLLKAALMPYGLQIEYFTTTNDTKRDAIEQLCSDIGEGRITLYDKEEQRREFSAYEMEFTKNGKITYNAPYGLHDDIVMSVAIALYGLNQLKTKSTYNISYGSKKNKNFNLRDKYEKH